MPETLTPPQQEHKVVSVPPDAELSQWTEHRVADGQVSELAQLDTSLKPPEDSLPAENQEARGQAEQLVPDGFKSVAEQLYEETDLAKRKELKAQAALELKPTLDSLDDESVEDYLVEVNETFGGVFSGEDLLLLSNSREKVVIVNDKGRLEEIEVSEENIGDVLMAVKAADAEKRLGNSYGLRHEILKRSKGKVSTTDAYTYATELPLNDADMKDYLDDPDSWIPEIAEWHERVVDEEYAKAQALSERLDDEEPTVYALRGNTAAGKTTAVRRNATFAKSLDEKGEPSGSINPDTQKTDIKNREAEEGRQTISHGQAHEEGSMLARKIQARIADSESSMVIDKRMSTIKNLNELIKLAEAHDKEIKILDVDVPLEISLVRVLQRPVGGDSPNVQFDAVAGGFIDIRHSRGEVLERAESDENITDYVLTVADSNGESVEVAHKVDGEIVIDPEREELFEQATGGRADAEATAKQLAETVITDEYIEEYIKRVHGNDPEGRQAQSARASLVQYKGKTFKQALDERASSLTE